MLYELSIKNFAIIDKITVNFEKGLTVLTGETGAGKSIIIDALHLLVGGRGSTEFIRHGERKAEIEGLFYLDSGHPCYKKLAECGIDIEEGMLILRREMSIQGKSVCRVNGKLVTIAILREIGGTLIDIHGQHEHQELMNESLHLHLLDQFGGTEIQQALENYQELYKKYVELTTQIKKLSENEQQMAHRLDLITFQLNEIKKANITLHEDDDLLLERTKLSNFEKLFAALKSSYDGLQGEQTGLDFISHVMGYIEIAAGLDQSYEKTLEHVNTSYYLLEDVSAKLRDDLESLEFDPNRLNEIESRLHELNQLKRKYGPSLEDILEYSAKIEEELEMITHKDDRIEQLEKKIETIKKDLLIEGRNVTQIRKKYAKQLAVAIQTELKQLYMEKTIFEPRFLQDDHENMNFKEDGMDQLAFYISTNPGEPLKPLSKVASGGELSRMMLALKTIFSQHQGITSIIFDEVDTGVSGRVAQAIAEKIHQVSVHSQVLCISHLPQVAAMADTHIFISKNVNDGRTSTKLEVLENDDKVNEIGRMISGTEITQVTKQHAKEMLKTAYTLKVT